ncbi:MAG: biotin/lipoyl-containing protein [Terracidiphilus sp.]
MKLQIAIDGKTYEAEVEVLEDDAMPRQQNYGVQQPHSGTIQSVQASAAPAQATTAQQAEESVGEDKLCRSPVTGIVIKVHVEPGQKIQANDLLVVLEAMKMETNVTAQHAGTVKNVRVAQGGSVKLNQVVVEFE